MKVSGTAVGLLLTIAASMSVPVSAWAQDAARLAAGEDAWNKAGCFQCHGTSGEGGDGGEYPAGPSLRAPRLDRATLSETISCGRPGTPMPAWLDGAYSQALPPDAQAPTSSIQCSRRRGCASTIDGEDRRRTLRRDHLNFNRIRPTREATSVLMRAERRPGR